MLVAKDLRKLFEQLRHEEVANISVGGTDITIRIFDKATMVALTSEIYFGGNFIPKSVRACTTKQSPFGLNRLKSIVTIDENAFRIYLNYLGRLDNMNNEAFRQLLEDFGSLSDKWRTYLDEHDKNDLIHVRNK